MLRQQLAKASSATEVPQRSLSEGEGRTDEEPEDVIGLQTVEDIGADSTTNHMSSPSSLRTAVLEDTRETAAGVRQRPTVSHSDGQTDSLTDPSSTPRGGMGRRRRRRGEGGLISLILMWLVMVIIGALIVRRLYFM